MRTTLLEAIVKRKYNTATLLLDSGSDPNASDSEGLTPLYLAVRRCNYNLVRQILSVGGIINSDICLETIHSGNAKILNAILEKDNSTVNRGESMLIESILQENIQKKRIVKLLIKYNCNVDALDKNNWSALLHAVQLNDVAIVKLLLRAGANPNVSVYKKVSALYLSIINRNVVMFDTLISYGARINVKSIKLKLLLLNEAIRSDILYFVSRILLKIKDVINMADDSGTTALMTAAVVGNYDVVKLLLKHGAMTTMRDACGRHALYFAAWYGHENVLELLTDDIDVTEMYRPLNPDDQVAKYPNAIFAAVANNHHFNIARLLIDKASDEELAQTNIIDQTVLHLAVDNRSLDVIQLLLSRKVVQNPDANQETPISIAIERNDLKLLVLLLSDDDNKHLYKIMLREIRTQNRDILKALISFGAAVREEHIKAAIDMVENNPDESDSDDIILDVHDRFENSILGILMTNYSVANSMQYMFALNYAVDNKNTKTVNNLRFAHSTHMQECKNIREKWKFRICTSTLHEAVNTNHVLFLLIFMYQRLKNVDINAVDADGETALEKAIRMGREEAAVLLIQYGADLRMDAGLLSKYCLNFSDDFHNLLIEAGVVPKLGVRSLEEIARISIRSDYTHFASSWKKYNRGMKILQFEYKLNVNKWDDEVSKMTALHYASSSIHLIHVIDALLDEGAEIDVVGKNDFTPLHVASVSGLTDIVLLLLKRGANPRQKNLQSQTPLILASIRGVNIRIVNALIDQAPDVINDLDDRGKSALHLASLYGYRDVVEALLNANADHSILDMYCKSPLHIASSNHYVEIVSLLLNRGADARQLNDKLQTPLMQVASETDDVDVMDALISADPGGVHLCNDRGESLLYQASWGAFQNVLLTLLNAGADINAENEEGSTPLHVVCMCNRLDAVLLYLTRGANARHKNHQQQTPLMLAAFNNADEKIIDALIAAAPDVINDADNDGETALHSAVYCGHRNTSEMLLNAGADFETKDQDGDTPLHVAFLYGHTEIASLLMSRGASVHRRNNQLATPPMLAEKYKSDIPSEDDLKVSEPRHSVINIDLSLPPDPALRPYSYFERRYNYCRTMFL